VGGDPVSAVPTCRHCNVALGNQQEKALSGEVAWVWASVLDGEWVCEVTGDEHCPAQLPCEHKVVVVEVDTGMDHDDVATMIQDLRAELIDKIEDLQREVEELRDRIND
jgi:hypothetical protein